MPLLLFFAIKLLAIAFLSTPSDGSADPCDSYNTLNDPYRSTGYVATAGKDPMICDHQLSTGWYRFINEVGGEMPENKTSKYHCGTYAPVWMKPPHPATADGIVDRTACVNFNNLNDGCLPIPIKVKKCNDSYFVYYLTATFGCSMAFCAGTARPCPRGQTGLWPNCNVSIKKDFPFAEVPVPEISYVEDEQSKPVLNCSFNFATWKNVSFRIQWFNSGRVVYTTIICQTSGSGCNRRYSTLTTSHYALGDTLRCDIQAMYNTHPNNTWTSAVSSLLFFAGIKIEPAHLNVTQCDAGNVLNRLSLKPNLPIRGGEIKVKFGASDDYDTLRLSECELTLRPGDEKTWHNISVQALCDNSNKPLAPSAFKFTVTSIEDPTLDGFWGFYELPAVLIRKIENRVKLCKATGDPHYTTFDGKYYDFYRPGDFVLYQNDYRNFEIHTRLWHCGRTVTCNCGVAIRELHDVIVLSSCTEDLQYNYGMPMKVEITSQGRLMRGTKILVGQSGKEYVVRLPSGTVVRIKRYYWGNNIEMEAPQFDKGKTQGMCGNFDGDQNNDFEQGGDKQSYGDADSFGESWRVNKSTSLFNVVPLCNDAICDSAESQLNMDRCTCQKVGGDVKVTCNLEIMKFNGLPDSGHEDRTNELEDASRKKRGLAYSDDIIYLYDNERSSPTVFRKRGKRAIHTEISLENATEYCRNRLLETTAAKICSELTGINASSAIQACAADLHLTGDFEWVESAFESLKSSCAFEAVSNFSAYERDEEGNFVPPMKIAQNLCPGNCNFNGNCTNGTCVCNEGFVSADCSVRFDEIPRLFRILDKGLCDIRLRPCRRTIIFGEYFSASENLTCHINEVSIVPGKWTPSNETKTLKGKQTDLFAIECQLPTPPLDVGNYDVEGTPAAGYQIAVSNDKTRQSEPLDLITYDSICQQCNISHGCFLKDESCLIRGHCFAKDVPNPSNWCLQCIPSTNQHNWTRRVSNLPPNITTPSPRYALVGEDLLLRLEGEDPENRPFRITMIAGSPSLASFSDSNVLHWTPKSLNSTKFHFKAIDECNASSTFNMTIEILTCPCTDKGTCVPDPNHPRGSGIYYCECQPGYEGKTCQKEIDECLQSPCLHGTCIDAVNNYSCQCLSGYSGYNCTMDVDECQSSPCVYGSCLDGVNSFNCSCQSGFSGDRCEENIDDCPSSGCGNGTCMDLIDNYTCQCNVGFAGQHCEVIVRNCSNDSCFQGVVCIQKTYTISCGPCPSGFTGDGKTCIDIDDCVNHPCNNSGSCADGRNNYTCYCLEGYTGNHCEIDINECMNHTCLNSASCVDGINHYKCHCAPGFTGDLCGTKLSSVNEQSSRKTSLSPSASRAISSKISTAVIATTVRAFETGSSSTRTSQTKNHLSPSREALISSSISLTAAQSSETASLSPLTEVPRTDKPATEKIATDGLETGEPETKEATTEESEAELTMELRVHMTWNDELSDKNSGAFKDLSQVFEKEIKEQYSKDNNFYAVKVLSFRQGSVVVEFKLKFREKLKQEDALAPLKEGLKDGRMGSLRVDAESLKVINAGEEETAESKIPLAIGIGISFGGIFFLALIIIALVRYCKRRNGIIKRYSSDGMPTEVSFPNLATYALRDENEGNAPSEEIPVSHIGNNRHEPLGISNEGVQYEKLDASSSTTNPPGDLGTLNKAVSHDELNLSTDAGEYA